VELNKKSFDHFKKWEMRLYQILSINLWLSRLQNLILNFIKILNFSP
jgi:hypothetical protein